MAERGFSARPTVPERVGDFLTSWVDRLPDRLRRALPKDLVGFAILGAFTFGVDIALLTLLHDRTSLPIPVTVGIAYIAAFALNFILNRTVNFRSHAPVGTQALRYAVVVAADFTCTVGGTSGLTFIGVDLRVARLTAAFCVATFTYSASRWWVFRDRLVRPGTPAPEPAADRRRA